MKHRVLKLTIASLGLLASSLVLAGVEVIDPNVRAVPPNAPASAAFMGLVADSDDVALVKADSEVARTVELHTHVHDNGVMRMRPVEKIPLKKGEEVRLQPGGYHIMLIGLKRPLKPGDNVEIELRFSDGSKQKISAPVRRIDMRMKMHGGQMRGGMPMQAH